MGIPPGGVFPAEGLAGSVVEAARNLLGSVLVSDLHGVRTAGVVVETEAYIGGADPASHAADRIGRTPRNQSMFGPPGHFYVYRIYGLHHCANVVCGARGTPLAILLRALHPLVGREEMARRRGRDRDLCSGPGRLCQALAVDGSHDGHDMERPPLRLLQGWTVPSRLVGVTGRVGVTQAARWPLRFFVRHDPSVSRAKAAEAGTGAAYRRALSTLEM